MAVRWARMVFAMLALHGCCAIGGGEAGGNCEAAKKDCLSRYDRCEDIWMDCKTGLKDGPIEVERVLFEGCVGDERADTCDIMMRHYREGELERHFTPEDRAKAIAATCSMAPKSVCRLVATPDPDGVFIERDLRRLEDALACDAKAVQKCGLTGAITMLGKAVNRDGLGERTAGMVEKACFAQGGEACTAAYLRYRPRYPNGLSDAALSFLTRACTHPHEASCTELASQCSDQKVTCDRPAVKAALAPVCMSAECLGAAARLFPDDYSVRACAAGHVLTCDRGLRDDAADVWERRFHAQCSQPREDATCMWWAAYFFRRVQAWESAVPFLESACKLGEKRACALAPHIIVELRPPKNRPGIESLDERCNEGEGRACMHLAMLYKWGTGVAESPPQSAAYADKACKTAKPLAPDEKANACAWDPSRPRRAPGGARPTTANPVANFFRILTLPIPFF